MWKYSKNLSGAFTLIEVLAATAILGVSMSILLSSMGTVSVAAEQLARSSRVSRAMYNAADVYRLEPIALSVLPNGSTARPGITSLPPYIADLQANRWVVKQAISGLDSSPGSGDTLLELRSVENATPANASYRKHVLTFRYQDVDLDFREKKVAVIIK